MHLVYGTLAAEGDALGDEAAPDAQQILQLRQGLVQRRGGLEAPQVPAARQHLGVHTVGLDRQAEASAKPGRTATVSTSAAARHWCNRRW